FLPNIVCYIRYFLTLSLHDALPIFVLAVMSTSTTSSSVRSVSVPTPSALITSSASCSLRFTRPCSVSRLNDEASSSSSKASGKRSEEHTSELQSRENLVCRLLLSKQ